MLTAHETESDKLRRPIAYRLAARTFRYTVYLALEATWIVAAILAVSAEFVGSFTSSPLALLLAALAVIHSGRMTMVAAMAIAEVRHSRSGDFRSRGRATQFIRRTSQSAFARNLARVGPLSMARRAMDARPCATGYERNTLAHSPRFLGSFIGYDPRTDSASLIAGRCHACGLAQVRWESSRRPRCRARA